MKRRDFIKGLAVIPAIAVIGFSEAKTDSVRFIDTAPDGTASKT